MATCSSHFEGGTRHNLLAGRGCCGTARRKTCRVRAAWAKGGATPGRGPLGLAWRGEEKGEAQCLGGDIMGWKELVMVLYCWAKW